MATLKNSSSIPDEDSAVADEQTPEYVKWSDVELALRRLQKADRTTRSPATTRRKRPPKAAMSEAPGASAGPTRERILVAAAQVLSERGYAGTRLNDIAEVAKVQAPAIYYYFPSREELIAEVMVEGQVRLRDHVERELRALPAEATPMDRVCAAIEAHLRVELQLSDFATAVTRNAGQLPEDIRARLRDEGTAYGALWRALLTEGRAQGQVRSDLDLRAAHMLIIGALNWTVEWWDAEKGSLENVIRTAQSLVRNGLSVGLHTAHAEPQ